MTFLEGLRARIESEYEKLSDEHLRWEMRFHREGVIADGEIMSARAIVLDVLKKQFALRNLKEEE